MSDTRNVFTAEERALLDAYAVPPLSAGWTERVMAEVRDGAVPPLLRQRAPRRVHWLRRGLYGAMTMAGAAVVTAAAAEQGLLGPAAKQQVQAVVAALGPDMTEPARAVRPVTVRQAKAETAGTSAAAVVVPPVSEAERIGPVLTRLQANPQTAGKVDRYLQRRAMRQQARGVAPTPPDMAELARQYRRLPAHRRQQLREDLRQLPPEDRAEILSLIRQYRVSRRQAARHEGGSVPEGVASTPAMSPEPPGSD